ncbi:hypothetical protein [Nostoc sp. CHAB 5715]|uniref:hypothetical protein n=1 Tax=Nostoc sp. CHAB 5715 TaxID=2780400 RepID=UPI001E468933|nr:hypothetical protein [Nostoc sp. CHAB 5715]MCC5621603.1 hypothetical protein [Nostoc sp. CHAB 5715]
MSKRSVVAVAGLLSVAAAAQADLQVFTASPSYPWTRTEQVGPNTYPGMQFDPLQGASQTGAPTSTSINQFYVSPAGSSSPTVVTWNAGSNIRIAVTPVAGFRRLVRPGLDGGEFGYARPTDFSAAGAVGPGGSFASTVVSGWSSGFQAMGGEYEYYVDHGTHFELVTGSLGASMVIGLELTLSGQTHYGWALIRRTGDFFGDPTRGDWVVERWAYETTANTAAAIPAPGAAAVLGLAGMLASRRRRK